MTDLFLFFDFSYFPPIFAIFQKSGLFEIQHFAVFLFKLHGIKLLYYNNVLCG